MFKCHICKSTNCHTKYVSETFKISGKSHLVENIPATVCSHCGAEMFSADTSESIRIMLHSKREIKIPDFFSDSTDIL
jgi:YgiT-type zinc finger domain-containing protein